ncbi:calcium-translocating P-type ATPase, SERCA-type [Candidatus Darwinibacter acetoxidans]|jgi:Ca2+-transporting ATPase|nr:calcium-translocating P-type ATPase, SERCA-type [Bacillota bacterium]
MPDYSGKEVRLVAGNWHLIPTAKLIKDLQVNPKLGLSTQEARTRLDRFGPNVLVSTPPIAPWRLFLNQFQDFMVLVLLGTVVISVLLGEYLDAVAIFAILFLNAVLGFVQEYRAERSIEMLNKLAADHCRVIRDGHKALLDASLLVPGDIILLEPGDRVPADARLLECQLLSVDESNLTGESVPVGKDEKFLGDEATPLGDRRNAVYKSTLVARGFGRAVVTATGMDTEIGRIAHLLQEKESSETPLQKRLQQLGRILVLACAAIVAVVFAAGVGQGLPVYKMFMVAVTLAVAAIPEGLPAVVTIALSVGVQRMSRQSAVIRQLPAVETLGCATVICSDKTGTLTLNQMEVQQLWTGRGLHSLGGQALRLDPQIQDDLWYSVAVGALCTKAEVYEDGSVFGDPTEVALLRLAEKAGLSQRQLRRVYEEVGGIPFSSERKRMSVVVRQGRDRISLVKGAPDVVLPRCTHIMVGTEVVRLTQERRREALTILDSMADQALRVLATAFKPLGQQLPPEEQWERGLIFTGFVGMIDPPRPEVAAAVQAARLGGVRTIMVTGDHKKTAAAIAEQIGLFTPEAHRVLTGAEWEALTPLEQRKAIRSTAVFARVAPTHKLSIVKALKANGEIVAMTGDGVNDAPAVKEAHIGVAMGIQGTDVTREASHMVLLDDNFGTIIKAVREGRGIYDNIRKFIRYLLGCNVGEVLTMLAATLLGLPLPLIPLQILWMNLVTDGLPAIALGLDPAERDIMLQKPRNPGEGVFARGLLRRILFAGVTISLAALALFLFSLWYYPGQLERSRTMAFTVLVMAQLIYAFQCRYERHSVFDLGIWGNLYLILAVLISGGAHVFLLYHPFMASVFQTVPLSGDDWILVGLFACFPLFAETAGLMVKRAVRRRLSLLKV